MAMEVSVELEDDLFFADLSRQISLLIMDEDDDQDPTLAPSPKVSLDLQAFSKAFHPPAQSFFLYEQTYKNERKGTGVFIPQSNQPRRKNKQGRSNFYHKKSPKQSEDTKLIRTSHVSESNSFKMFNSSYMKEFCLKPS